MAEKAPFQKLIFTLTDRANGRVLFQMTQRSEDEFDLHVEKGPTTQLVADFTRTVPLKTAENLRDALASLGVFGWDEEYADDVAPGSKRWSLKIVFQEGVYTQECSGGSNTPEGFDGLLEEFYQLDLPRPGADDAPGITAKPAAFTGMPDMSSLFAGAPEGGPDAAMIAEMQQAMAELQANPALFQQQIKEEFKMLPPEQQENMLDMLASTGFATREWWEQFLRGL